MTGKVKWLDYKKGFGFIQTDDGKEIFVHLSAITGVKNLMQGTTVEFDVTRGPKRHAGYQGKGRGLSLFMALFTSAAVVTFILRPEMGSAMHRRLLILP